MIKNARKISSCLISGNQLNLYDIKVAQKCEKGKKGEGRECDFGHNAKFELTVLAMISTPSTFAETYAFTAMSVAGTIRHDAFRNPDFAFRSFPTVDAMAFAASIHSVSTTQQRTNT